MQLRVWLSILPAPFGIGQVSIQKGKKVTELSNICENTVHEQGVIELIRND